MFVFGTKPQMDHPLDLSPEAWEEITSRKDRPYFLNVISPTPTIVIISCGVLGSLLAISHRVRS
jgi:hypothetical protein